MITKAQTKKEIKNLIRDTKQTIDEAKTKLEAAEDLLATLELEFSRLGKLTNQQTPVTVEPRILTYETARVHQKVRLLNSPYGIVTIQKKGTFFASCTREVSNEKIRRSYSKLQTLDTHLQEVVDQHNSNTVCL